LSPRGRKISIAFIDINIYLNTLNKIYINGGIMTYLIKKWYLPAEEDEFIKDYTFKTPESKGQDWLENLSKVNIFVGPNNSGKSRFMRHLLSLKTERFSPANYDLDRLITQIRDSLTELRQPYKNQKIAKSTLSGLFNDKIIPLPYVESGNPKLINIDDFLKLLEELINIDIKFNQGTLEQMKLAQIYGINKEKVFKNANRFSEISDNIPPGSEFLKIYIPTLRGLRPVAGGQDIFRERTIKDYFEKHYFDIFTGLGMFGEVRKHLLGDLSKRKLIRRFEEFLGEAFFEGKELSLIPREEVNNDVLYVKIGNEKEFPIHNLGDGIQQIIIIMFPLFINEGKNILLFIEEPELYLHPGLQRILLKKLTSDDFLDLSLDFSETSIFKFTKSLEEAESEEARAKFLIESTSNKDRNMLELLGVKNSSVLLTNCTIWVEGITDRLYIRKYLDVFQNNLKEKNEDTKIFDEDRHYSFVEYSGNNITHWSFLEDSEESIEVDALCGTLFLVADQDEEKEERHKKLKKVLGSRYYPLNCREIENLLIPRVLEETIRDFPKVIFKKKPEILDADYNTAKLGEYIDKNILQGNSGKKFKSKYGSINCKLDFAKKAITHINSIDDMSKEAFELTEKIYNFIKEKNK
jgi:hypothetical protein